jgi:hypothetical protein
VYDGYQCRVCSENCAVCYEDSVAISCRLCNDGYYFLEHSESCLNYAPTGYTLVDFAEYETNPSTLASFTFTHVASQLSWASTNEWADTTHSWTVTAFGGLDIAVREVEDPFLTSDRGLWFDGRYNYMTIEGLTLSHTWAFETWVNPITPGTLFSTAMVYDHQVEVLAHVGFTGDRIEFEDKRNHFYAKTDLGVMSYD